MLLASKVSVMLIMGYKFAAFTCDQDFGGYNIVLTVLSIFVKRLFNYEVILPCIIIHTLFPVICSHF